jgi:hypothetical protein
MDRRLRLRSSAVASILPSQPRSILEEEEYESTLSHIVTRDYFPSLPSLRRDAEILDARSRGDMAGAVAARRRARAMEMQEEKERMEDGEEEERALMVANNCGESMDGVGLRVRPRQLKHESITGFHARVTSEDNAEFESNQERERKEREAILGVVYASRADKRGRLMIESHINGGDENNEDGYDCDKRLCYNRDWCDTPIGLSSDLYDAPPQGPRITDGKSTTASNDNGIGRNGLFFQPRDTRLCVSSDERLPSSSGTFLALENDTETKTIENCGEKNSGESDNLLMPPPPTRLMSAADKTLTSCSNAKMHMASAVDRRHQLVEYLPKQSLSNIHPPATRFPYQNESRLPSSNSNLGTIITSSVSRGIVNRNGSFSTTDASDTTDLDEPPRQLDAERAARKRARDRENETFVAMTPLIRPGDGEHGDTGGYDEPIMTWGNVISTPLVLGGGSAIDARTLDWEPSCPPPDDLLPAPAFDVIDSNRRETLARTAERRLMDRAKTYRSAGSVSSYKESDDESIHSSRSTRSTRSTRSMSSSVTNPMDRSASLTPAARALLDAQKMARHSKRKESSGRTLSSIFSGSRESFGSSLRASYTPDLTKLRNSTREGAERKKRKGDSSLRRASSGATPRCHLTLR